MITKDTGPQVAEGASDLGRDAVAEISGVLRGIFATTISCSMSTPIKSSR